ncbi:unnamed protein product [Pedinophyceae sp. YPF-701]|nr:unnamed protein product [Pedinophyceae sp. YPF-701]
MSAPDEGFNAGTRRQDLEVKLPKAAVVKNKQPAAQQITAEQLLREAKSIQLEDETPAPHSMVTDPEELADLRLKKRMQFEDQVRRSGRFILTTWIRYAKWEEEQKDFRRARSVWERALEINYRHVPFWLQYAEMEMRNRFVNHARNVWDRAVTYLPRVDQLWYKYVHMEEMLGNVGGARGVFERWMKWEPDEQGWQYYVNFELRYNEVDNVRNIFERFVRCHPRVPVWIKYAKFELKHGSRELCREVYERCAQELGEDAHTEEYFGAFATFETMVKEYDRARALYKFGLDRVPKSQAPGLYKAYMAFEKQYGDHDAVEGAVLGRRRFEYEEEVTKNPMNYDTWFDYARLEESGGDAARVRDVYERAIAHIPPAMEKQYWRRYIYLWINYALFEELQAGDLDRAKEVYAACLNVVPHKTFTFAKIWIAAAHLEIRRLSLDGARRLFGTALGLCPREKVFKAYIDMELQLGNVDRCRTLYEKFVELAPHNCGAWCRFGELEASLGEVERARAIFELAIQQPSLDMPELVWKSYIDMEAQEGGRPTVRSLYERLLERTKHVKVWISFARFEASPVELFGADDVDDEARQRAARGGEGDEAPGPREKRARGIYERAFRTLREELPDAKEEAVMLLEAWQTFEEECVAEGEDHAQLAQVVSDKMPKRVKRRRPVLLEDGTEAGQEEYWDYVFPEEARVAPHLKLLEAAQRWKKQKTQGE